MRKMTQESKTQKYSVVPYKIDENKFVEVTQVEDTIWLTQKQMAQLFDCSHNNILCHLNNFFKNNEIDKNVVCKKFLQTTQHGAIKGKEQTKAVTYYNLDAIIYVGYRVNTSRGIKFRQWATQVIKERMQEEWAKRNRSNQCVTNINIENFGATPEFLAQHLYMPAKELAPLINISASTLRRKCQKKQVQYKKVKGSGGIRYEILLLSLKPELLQTIFGSFAQYLQTPSLPAPQEHQLITSAKELTADALQGDAVAYQKLNKMLEGAAAIYNFEE